MGKRKSILFIGVVAVLVNISIVSISIYFGLRSGLSLYDVIDALSDAIYLKFYAINILTIAFFSALGNAKIILHRLRIPVLIVSLVLALLNAWMIAKNFLSIFNALFYFFYASCLYGEKQKGRGTKSQPSNTS
jgi:hypothetical protein